MFKFKFNFNHTTKGTAAAIADSPATTNAKAKIVVGYMCTLYLYYLSLRDIVLEVHHLGRT
jgi:hypothetical protein